MAEEESDKEVVKEEVTEIKEETKVETPAVEKKEENKKVIIKKPETTSDSNESKTLKETAETVNKKDDKKKPEEKQTSKKPISIPKSDVIIDKDSKLYSMIKKEKFVVNSIHKCKIDNPGAYSIKGFANDNIIELLELNGKGFNIGVQWHPEFITDKEEENQIFKEFIDYLIKNN